MTYTEKARYIDNMPFEMFVELFMNGAAKDAAYKEVCELLPAIKNQYSKDNRYDRNKLNIENIVSAINIGRSTLASKLISLEVLFNDDDYFNEICETFTKHNIKTNKDEIDYDQVAKAYNTTPDNVRANILYNRYKELKNSNNNSLKK